MSTLREDLVDSVTALEKLAADGETLLRLDSTITELKDLLEHHQDAAS